jgi:hypothetical protein
MRFGMAIAARICGILISKAGCGANMKKDKKIASQDKTPRPTEDARVIFDSSVSASAFGVRGFGSDRHLLFVDPELDIHLKIGAVGPRQKELYGQVIWREQMEEPSVVMLRVEEKVAGTTRTEQFGEFSFPEVPPGNIAVEILMPSRCVLARFDA